MERILVIEDDSFFREVFSDLLREEGYDVEVASSGEEALEILGLRSFHVVVTDLVMKDVSGLDILSRVKQKDPAIEVIMVTGHGNLETAVFALKNGARDYLVKPINHEELKHTVALCIEQRRLLDENHELKELVNLFQVSQTIANCLDMDRLHSLVVDALAKEIGLARGVAYFVEGSDQLELKEVRGFDEATALLLGDTALANFDVHDDKADNFIHLHNFVPAGMMPDNTMIGGVNDAMILSLRFKKALQGVIIFFNEAGHDFPSAINHKNLNFLIDQASLAFENAARFTSAKNLLYIDELTGLFNYRYLEIALERELKRAERYGSSLSVLFLDLDLFKNVNDCHGHLVGSKVLKEVGILLKKSVREVDSVMRYGGDEYTVILVETGVGGAATVAERIRRSIEAHNFLADEGYTIKLTASLGYACFPDDAKTKTDLLELADRAMYRGKSSGKNMVFYLSPRNAEQ